MVRNAGFGRVLGALLAVSLTLVVGCSDGTGSQASLEGQWLYRVEMKYLNGHGGCAISGVVIVSQTGASVSGRMPYPVSRCTLSTTIEALDSTTVLSGTVDGDSAHLQLSANGLTLHQSVLLSGDSLAGVDSDDYGGLVGGRRYAESFGLGRATLQLSGSRTGTLQFAAVVDGARLVLSGTNPTGPSLGPALLFEPYDPHMTVGTSSYSVGAFGSAYGGAYVGPLVGNKLLYLYELGQGTVTYTSHDAQTAQGTFDYSAREANAGDSLRVQGSFVAITSRYIQY
jgi:hypothetical protein